METSPQKLRVHTVPSADGWAGEYIGPMTRPDGDGRRGAWALFPFLPSLPSKCLRLPPLRQVLLGAPPALTDEKKRRNPGLDDQMDARRSHPIMPHHFKRPWPVRSTAGWVRTVQPDCQTASQTARRTSMPFALLLLLSYLLHAGCTLRSSRGSE